MKIQIQKVALIFIVTFFFSCNHNVIMLYTNKKTNEKMEKLDINKLKAQKHSETKHQRVKVWKSPENHSISEYNLYDKANNINTKIFRDNFEEGYYKSVCYYDYYMNLPCIICDLSFFNNNGILVHTGKGYGGIVEETNFNKKSVEDAFLRENKCLQIGIWKVYNTEGNVIREIDYEENFEFNLKKVLDYINSIPNLSVNGGGGNEIKREGKEWIITYSISEEKKNVMDVRLDGKTGKIISERKLSPRQF